MGVFRWAMKVANLNLVRYSIISACLTLRSSLITREREKELKIHHIRLRDLNSSKVNQTMERKRKAEDDMFFNSGESYIV